MKTRKLGNLDVSVIALGCMGMSGSYGPSDENEGIATIHRALERGVNLIDTGDFYGQGHNELLIRRALDGKRDRALLSVKFGAMRGPDGAFVGIDTRPAAVKNFLAYTLQRLGTDHVDIYRPARLDPNVPIEDTVGAIADLIKAGWVRAIGLSEVGAATVAKAHAVHPIVDLQIEYSLISRKPEETIFPRIFELGVSATAYGVLSRGLLSGSRLQPGDFRARMPRFAAENRAQNQILVEKLAQLAAARGVTAAQLCIAWALAKHEQIVPVIGARTRAQLDSALDAAEVALSATEIAEIERAVPASAVAGTRYDANQMLHLDSEK